MKLGDPVSLLARIGLEPGTETNVPLKEVTVPPEGLDCVLILNAPGFEIQSGDRRKLRLPHAADSDWVYFDLKAVRAGVHRLVVTAFVEGGSYLGDLLLETTVDSGMRTGESRERRQFLRARRLTAGEVALRIWFDDEKKVYRFHLNDGSILPADDQESDRLIETPSGAVKELIDQIHQVARARVQFNSVQETRAWLQGKGIALWDLLIPGELKRRFWELAGEIQRIFIVSGRQGDPIPWELLYPIQQGTSNDLGFLAERFHISRWIGSDDLLAPSQDLQLAGAAFIDPVGSNLDSAREEIKKIRELLDGRGARTSEPISDLTTLRGLLDRGGFGLLHFACHNSYGAQTISMGAKPFQPSDLGIYQNRFATTSPLVFLNACRSDSKDASFTALSGWARAFLKTAVGAFVGTLWEVRDATASTFAEEFYRSLLGDGKQQKPRSLGEALQAARNAIRDVPGDPTWLAYTLYGDSTAMLAPGGTE